MSPFTTLFFTSTLAIIVSLLLSLSLVNAQCCSNRGDFECCGVGPCNLFCCGCDRGCVSGCKFDPTHAFNVGKASLQLLGAIGGRKREIGVNPKFGYYSQPVAEYDVTVRAFESVDLNHDRVIDLNEGLSYLKNVTLKRSVSKRSVKREEVEEFTLQFESLDVNGDGVLEPHEFDRTLA